MTLWKIRAGLLFGATLVFAVTLAGVRLHAETVAQEPSEYQVKAAFLYNFVKFVEWPAGAGAADGSIEVCVLGKDPFGGTLDRAVEGKTVNARPITIRRINDVSIAKSCNVLFVGESEARHVSEIAKAVQTWSVLTVSEIKCFSERGGIIAFVMEGQRVRFRINSKAAAAAHLTISSKLLQLALATPQGKDK